MKQSTRNNNAKLKFKSAIYRFNYNSDDLLNMLISTGVAINVHYFWHDLL